MTLDTKGLMLVLKGMCMNRYLQICDLKLAHIMTSLLEIMPQIALNNLHPLFPSKPMQSVI